MMSMQSVGRGAILAFCFAATLAVSPARAADGGKKGAASAASAAAAAPPGAPVAAASAAAPAKAARRLIVGRSPEPQDSPEEAQRFFLKKRLGPGMTGYPVGRLLRAREDAKKLPLFSTRLHGRMSAPEGSLAAQSLAWTPLGPGNVGGRTRALKFVPGSGTTMYAAGVSGGVWKSTDTGANWTALGDAMASMAVTALLIDPSNTSVIYAGTGEGYFDVGGVRGAGIFKSTDGGSTWSQLSSTNNANFYFITDLAFDPANSAIIYATTAADKNASGVIDNVPGLYRSIDGGVTWTLIIDASNSSGCMNVVYRSDADTALASCGTFSPTQSSNGIWRSSNASAASPTWTHVVGPAGSGATKGLANMGRTSLAIAPSSQGTIYALMSCYPDVDPCGTGDAFAYGLLAVYKSTDGGSTWNAAYASTFNVSVLADLLLTNPWALLCGNQLNYSQGWYDNTIAVDPTNANRVFVGGIEAFRSDDGGATWGTIAYWWVNDPSNTEPAYLHADHHGLVFHPAYNGTSETRVYDINDGGIFVSTDAASSPKATSSTNICPVTASDLVSANWASLNHGFSTIQFYHGTVYPSGAEYFAGAQDNGTVRGYDGNPNGWGSINDGDGGYTAIDSSNSGPGTVLYSEHTGISIEKSTTGGFSFVQATAGISDIGQFINPFQMDPNNTQRLFTSGTALWRSNDAAGSWTQASAALTGTSCPLAGNIERFSNYAIAPGNSDLLVAGTDNGRICSLTNATGSTSGTALSSCTQPAGACAYVSAIAFDPNSATTAYASISTFGVGHVWKSINSGQTWTNISGSGANALPDAPAHSVAVSPLDANTIYVGTEIGVFVTANGGSNWARENTGFPNVITNHLVFNSSVAKGWQLYAFTYGRGVFRAPLVPPVATTTTLTPTPSPSVFGQSVTLTAVVSSGSGTPTGLVSFYDVISFYLADSLGSNISLDGAGHATVSTSALAVGVHTTLYADYPGNAAYDPSFGTASHTVNKASTTVSIGSDNPDPSVFGQSVTVTASVAVTAPGGGTPTGSIVITASNSSGCTITLPQPSCSLTFTMTGPQTIDAVYGGDGNFNGSNATQIDHSVVIDEIFKNDFGG